MTKEEILGQYHSCTCDKIYTSRKMIDPSCIFHNAEFELAMDQFAQQQAIAFSEWTAKEDWRLSGDGTWFRMMDLTINTTEQLYDIFLISNNDSK